MKLQRRSRRFVTMAVVVALPLLGMSSVASAKARATGCHKTHTCKSGRGGTTGSGTGAGPAPITVQVDPTPLVETSQSDVLAIVQVETSPSFAGDPVDISSSQLQSVCTGGAGFAGTTVGNPARVMLDDDGNATVRLSGRDCAPGTSVVEADLAVAPYDTALTTLNAVPPVVTTPGVFGYPQTSGTVTGGEVETGDTSFPGGGSFVYGVFYVETDPVYAEQTVEISSSQLQDRCGTGWDLFPLASGDGSAGIGSVLYGNATATTTLDDDGNAAFFFQGASCAAGSSVVTADVEAGSHPTYTTTFNVLSPQPTI